MTPAITLRLSCPTEWPTSRFLINVIGTSTSPQGGCFTRQYKSSRCTAHDDLRLMNVEWNIKTTSTKNEQHTFLVPATRVYLTPTNLSIVVFLGASNLKTSVIQRAGTVLFSNTRRIEHIRSMRLGAEDLSILLFL